MNHVKEALRRLLLLPGVNDVMRASLHYANPSTTLARLPVARKEVAGMARDVRYVLLHPKLCTIAKELYWGRGRRIAADEQLALELFCDLARDADTVLDIGANTGVFTLVAGLANPHARVHAFEIVPEVYEVLFQNVVRNDIADRVECHFMGVGEARIINLPRIGSSSLPTSVSSDMQTEAGLRVEFRPLDTHTSALARQSRVLMKIDVEGTESDVFRHGWTFVREFRPRIICEILRSATTASTLGRELQQYGYRFYNITGSTLRESDTLQATPHRDWLFACDTVEQLREATSVQVERSSEAE